MASIVPSLSELLNRSPGIKYPLHDGKITTRCPKSDCFNLQRLSESTITKGMFETRYCCAHCGTTMVVVRPSTAPDPGLAIATVLGAWTYWVSAAGVHLRLANASRVRSEPDTPPAVVADVAELAEPVVIEPTSAD
jgi:hypothetical protein